MYWKHSEIAGVSKEFASIKTKKWNCKLRIKAFFEFDASKNIFQF